MILKNTPPPGFLEEEERCGFTVSVERKKLWAIQIDMLQELLRVCKKYNLRIFADGGTMLGAVRHHGYIPWDDDIDMAMPREDYDVLQRVAPDEFTHPHFFQNIYTDNLYMHRHSQLRNTETALLPSKGKKGVTSSNCGLFIDIFPLDYMPRTPRRVHHYLIGERARKQRLKFTQKILRCLPYPFYKYCREHIDALSDKKLFARYEDFLRDVDGRRSVSWSMITLQRSVPIKSVHSYDEVEWVPFEYIKIPIPRNYDENLRVQYGDYMTPVRSAAIHGSFEYDTERSYKEYYRVRE